MSNRVLPMLACRPYWLFVLLLVCSLVFTPSVAKAALPATVDAQADEAEWLIMLYSDADDNILEEDMMIDLQEAELVGSTDQVTIVAQTDRFKGGYAGMGDWTTRQTLPDHPGQ